MQNEFRICILGLGYVGQHLISDFKNKYQVLGIDINEKRINELRKSLDEEITLQSDYSNLTKYNVFLISVPTLIKNGEIDLSFLNNVNERLSLVLKGGDTLVIESSVYVGATREIFGHYRNRGVFVGFSPERVDPGRFEPKIEDIPKIISGIDSESLEKVQLIYSCVFNNIVPVSSTECAEMCKLYENCFRMVNIAYVNEIADMCNNMGINSQEMIKASSTKPFGFMPFYPGIGIGGGCIPCNPYYLFKNGDLPVLQLATQLMADRPEKKAYEIISKYPSKNYLICGIGFKKGESLLTNSPSLQLYYQLLYLFKHVLVFDPFVQNQTTFKIDFITTLDAKYLKSNNYVVIIVHNYNILFFEEYSKLGGNVIWYGE